MSDYQLADPDEVHVAVGYGRTGEEADSSYVFSFSLDEGTSWDEAGILEDLRSVFFDDGVYTHHVTSIRRSEVSWGASGSTAFIAATILGAVINGVVGGLAYDKARELQDRIRRRGASVDSTLPSSSNEARETATWRVLTAHPTVARQHLSVIREGEVDEPGPGRIVVFRHFDGTEYEVRIVAVGGDVVSRVIRSAPPGGELN